MPIYQQQQQESQLLEHFKRKAEQLRAEAAQRRREEHELGLLDRGAGHDAVKGSFSGDPETNAKILERLRQTDPERAKIYESMGHGIATPGQEHENAKARFGTKFVGEQSRAFGGALTGGIDSLNEVDRGLYARAMGADPNTPSGLAFMGNTQGNAETRKYGNEIFAGTRRSAQEQGAYEIGQKNAQANLISASASQANANVNARQQDLAEQQFRRNIEIYGLEAAMEINAKESAELQAQIAEIGEGRDPEERAAKEAQKRPLLERLDGNTQVKQKIINQVRAASGQEPLPVPEITHKINVTTGGGGPQRKGAPLPYDKFLRGSDKAAPGGIDVNPEDIPDLQYGVGSNRWQQETIGRAEFAAKVGLGVNDPKLDELARQMNVKLVGSGGGGGF